MFGVLVVVLGLKTILTNSVVTFGEEVFVIIY